MFDIVKKNYERGLWTDKMVEKLVEKKVITEDQYKKMKQEKAKDDSKR